MIESLIAKIALIGIIGIGAQWLAWRTGRPAIALMLAAGIIAGPVLGIIVPERDFGPLQGPIVKLAVAVILFEGGLSLNFRDLREAGWPVLRLVIFGVPIGWGLGAAAAHYGAGLDWPVALLFGGILVVTGPTVIGPMLRTLNIPKRVADTLRWEGIVNDPIGALLAIGVFGYITFEGPGASASAVTFEVLSAAFVAALLGVALAFALTWAFPRGFVPEYLKAPVLLVTVIAGFVLADTVKHETGLITVTIMGVVMANRTIESSRALRRFKEDLSVLLISGLFVILAATLDWSTISAFQARFVIFLLLLLFVVRPVTVLASLLFSSMPWRERLFIAWIAPRGIVAVAVTGLFAIRLTEYGIGDGALLVPLSFAVVAVTIFAHGFSASWLSRRLGIDRGKRDGVLLVGANDWTTALGNHLAGMGYPVTVADTSTYALRVAERSGLAIHRGEVLDEVTHDTLDMGSMQVLIAASDNDAYNALVGADLAPEMGHQRILQTAPDHARRGAHPRARVVPESGRSVADLQQRIAEGWRFATRQVASEGWDTMRQRLGPSADPIAVVRGDGSLAFFTRNFAPSVAAGEQVIVFAAAEQPSWRSGGASTVEAPASAA